MGRKSPPNSLTADKLNIMKRSKIIFLYLGAAALLIVAVILLLAVTAGNSAQSNKKELAGRALVSAPEDLSNVPNTDGRLIVGAGRVPTSVKGAQESAPLATLPSRMPLSSRPDQTGPDSDFVKLPARQRQEIMSGAGNFLRAWETFNPEKEGYGNGGYLKYTRSLRSVSAPGKDTVLAQRTDAREPCLNQGNNNCALVVCPEAGCLVGSKFILDSSSPIFDQIGGNFTVRAADEKLVWITGYGTIEYRSAFGHPLDGRKFHRAYSLILMFSQGSWLVDKASSESVEETS